MDIAYAHVNDPVPELPEQVPANVRELIYTLLSKKPSDRPTTAQDLARRLDRIIIALPSDDAVTWNANPPQNWAPAQHEPKTAAKGTPISNKPHSRMPNLTRVPIPCGTCCKALIPRICPRVPMPLFSWQYCSWCYF